MEERGDKVHKVGGDKVRQRPASKGAQGTKAEVTVSRPPAVSTPDRAKRRPTARASPSSSAHVYEGLGVLCLILAALLGVAAFVLHYDPQNARHLETGISRGAQYLAHVWETAKAWTQSFPSPSPSAGPPASEAAKRVLKLYTPEELRQYDGSEPDKPILLGILGKVYDVTKGSKFYATGGPYAFFSGRDASRAFATGQFDEQGLTDDVDDLEPEQVAAIHEWQQTFNKQYTYVGKIVGRFYDAKGQRTNALNRAKSKIKKAQIIVDDEQEEKRQFPDCNSRWSEKEGTTVWCTEASGGIQRSWQGYPRQFKSSKNKEPRCACIRKKLLDDPRVRPYEQCDPLARECKL